MFQQTIFSLVSVSICCYGQVVRRVVHGQPCIPGISYCPKNRAQSRLDPSVLAVMQNDTNYKVRCHINQQTIVEPCGRRRNYLPPEGAQRPAYCYQKNERTAVCLPYCTSGMTYCGAQLNSSVFGFVSKDALYICEEDGTSVRLLLQCPGHCHGHNLEDGYCRNNCASGLRYCFWNLVELYGWKHAQWMSRDNNNIVQCSDDGSNVFTVQNCEIGEHCYQNGTSPYCRQNCRYGARYCGRDLLHLNGWEHTIKVDDYNTIFTCLLESELHNKLIALPTEICHSGCRSGSKPLCQTCEPSRWFCGYELRTLGFPASYKFGLYSCKSDKKLSLDTFCHSTCHADAPSCPEYLRPPKGSYCGHQLSDKHFEQQARYDYSTNTLGEHLKLWPCKNGCIAKGEASQCAEDRHCVPGKYYCGYELDQMGMLGGVRNRTGIYVCVDVNTTQYVHGCKQECASYGYAHCSDSADCTPGYLYCGHEITHVGLLNKLPHALYQCTSFYYFDYVEKCSQVCSPGIFNATCSGFEELSDRCGLNNDNVISPLLWNGQATDSANFPWMASLRLSNMANMTHLCSAVIISKRWLLTAAHCLASNNSWIVPTIVTAMVGQFGRQVFDHGERMIKADRIVLFPKSPRYLYQEGDIALIKLQQSIEVSHVAQSICLPDDTQLSNLTSDECLVAGWGWENGTISESLHFGKIQIVSEEHCKSVRVFPFNYRFNDSFMICVNATRPGDAMPCKGDSGGPLFCRRNGHWSVYGIVSLSLGKDRCQRSVASPAVFTLVTPFVSWIHDIVEEYKVSFT